MEAVFEKIMEFLASAEGASMTVAVVVDFALRMIPSEKPKSVFHMVSFFARKSSEVLGKLADVMDKILPQKLK